MRIFGVDFTSAPRRTKPITLACCRLAGDRLICERVERLETLGGFEMALATPGPWVMGADFPFAFARGLAAALGWPEGDWRAFAAHLAGMDRAAYEAALSAHRKVQPAGERHLFRAIDRRCGGAAPNNIVNPPVGKMLFEGVTRLHVAGVSLPGLAEGDPARCVVEAYPAVAARALIGPAPYKDGPAAERDARRNRRHELLSALAGPAGPARFGLVLEAEMGLADDDTGGDVVDALVCAVQGAWAYRAGLTGPQGPTAAGAAFDAAEGWIADPDAFDPSLAATMIPGPPDAAVRRAARPVICYPTDTLPAPDVELYARARVGAKKSGEVLVPPRDARCFRVPAGHFFRISCVDGPQVGDLNLWNAADLSERFYSGKTRALHGSHVTRGHRLWSSFPRFRPMATITHDSLEWYGFDADGAGVHDVIGTRCDPYTHVTLTGTQYHNCCHSNLVRALAAEMGVGADEAETHVHDVLNVFMCTGFTRDTHQYFMKASPVRPDDYLEFFAEIDLLGALSACPGGDCGERHSSDAVACYPLRVETFSPTADALADWMPPGAAPYDGSHGL